MNREEALQWCVENVSNWGLPECAYTKPSEKWGWGSFKGSLQLTHPTHDPITREDWQIAKHNSEWTLQPYTVTQSDQVHKPKHYEVLDGFEAIEVIAASLTPEQWKGYCVGNIIKYRLRSGKKDALQQDIDKANEYEMLFEKHKGLNRAK